MLKGYSEYDSTHSKVDAKEKAEELRKHGYGARIINRKIKKGVSKGAIVYEILKSNVKLKKYRK